VPKENIANRAAANNESPFIFIAFPWQDGQVYKDPAIGNQQPRLLIFLKILGRGDKNISHIAEERIQVCTE
jgi:hypothetical protein